MFTICSHLKDERRQVSEMISKAGFFPAGMELFPASDQQQLEFIQRVIDGCDYYVVIVGGRYGSLADDNVSFTEKEYEYAVARRMPVLAFLHGAPERIEVGKSELDAGRAAKLKAFRDRLSTGRLVKQWRDLSELCNDVLIALVQESNQRPGIGWVRGDRAIDPKLLLETERLRLENEELKQKLREAAGDEIQFPKELADPNQDFVFRVQALKYTLNETVSSYGPKGSVTGKHRKYSKPEEFTVTAKLGDVFSGLFERPLGRKHQRRSVVAGGRSSAPSPPD
jgi:hypothetical protein